MRYRLEFRVTSDGYLQITGFAENLPVISAIHLNEKVFAATVRIAQIAPFQALRLLEAAREAGNQQGITVCCEVVEFNQTQIDAICLHPGTDKMV